MYFRGSGCDSVVWLINGLIVRLINSSRFCGSPEVMLTVGRPASRGQTFFVRFKNVERSSFDAEHLRNWLAQCAGGDAEVPWEISAALGACRQFVIQRSDSGGQGMLTWKKGEAWVKEGPGKFAPSLKFTLKLDGRVFPSIGHDHVYRLAGALRDQSSILAGLKTTVRSEASGAEIQYLYPEGLKSLLFEEEYARHSMHGGCMHFSAARQDVSVQCALRFVHGGVSHLKSFVNGHPVQGGSHAEGLGNALKKLFPRGHKGCRRIPFFTNPDTGSSITLPHAFVAAMNVNMSHPNFYSPTRDVLLNPEMVSFLEKEARKALAPQLEFLGVR